MTAHPFSPTRLAGLPALLIAALLAACGNNKPGADATYIVTLRYCSAAAVSSCSAANQNGLGDFSAVERQEIRDAADRMQQVIAAGLTAADTSGLRCYTSTAKTNGVVMNETVHGLLVLVMKDAIADTAVVAESGPCIVRVSNGLPLVAVMRFNSSGTLGVSSLHTSGQLTSVAFHELFHTLGFGTLWSPDPETHKGFDLVTTSATDPRYNGAQALARAKSDNGAPGTWASIPVDNTGMEGTAGSHWRQEVFSNWATSSGPWELMAGQIPPSGTIPMTLSATTLGAIADLGYTVRFALAEEFKIPNPTAVAAQAYALRAVEGGVSLGDDALHLPLEQADDTAQQE